MSLLAFASTITGLCSLGASQPVAAQNLTYNLFGVTFNDGAVAYGFFNFNPTTDQFGNYDITTTDGVSDTLPGQHYFSSLQNPGVAYFLGVQGFVIETPKTATNDLFLEPAGAIPSTSGVFPLAAGTVDPSGKGLDSGSGEFHFGPPFMVRSVASGSLFVTNPVPEASTTVSFGLLLALGLGGMVIAAKRKKTNVEKAGAAV